MHTFAPHSSFSSVVLLRLRLPLVACCLLELCYGVPFLFYGKYLGQSLCLFGLRHQHKRPQAPAFLRLIACLVGLQAVTQWHQAVAKGFRLISVRPSLIIWEQTHTDPKEKGSAACVVHHSSA